MVNAYLFCPENLVHYTITNLGHYPRPCHSAGGFPPEGHGSRPGLFLWGLWHWQSSVSPLSVSSRGRKMGPSAARFRRHSHRIAKTKARTVCWTATCQALRRLRAGSSSTSCYTLRTGYDRLTDGQRLARLGYDDVIWVKSPCGLAGSSQSSGDACRLHIWGWPFALVKMLWCK
jgi:hypothetical protein